jgi:hypothetical protein
MRLLNADSDIYRNMLMEIGNGTFAHERIGDHDDFITIPENIFMPLSKENLFETVFEDFENQHNNSDYINNRAILCPLNKECDEINDFITDKLPGELQEFRSIDSIDDSDYHTNFYPIEYLNTLSFSGIPPHILRLKVGQPIILMRNISNYKGLCNGTRMIIKRNNLLIYIQFITNNYFYLFRLIT